MLMCSDHDETMTIQQCRVYARLEVWTVLKELGKCGEIRAVGEVSFGNKILEQKKFHYKWNRNGQVINFVNGVDDSYQKLKM